MIRDLYIYIYICNMCVCVKRRGGRRKRKEADWEDISSFRILVLEIGPLFG